MWTFDQGSFVPHGLDGDDATAAPAVIGCEPPEADAPEVLISLGTEVPDCFQAYGRILELVDAGDDDKLRARRRYMLYKDHGCELETHHLDP
jgi:DNA polymerase-3 subunit chi